MHLGEKKSVGRVGRGKKDGRKDEKGEGKGGRTWGGVNIFHWRKNGGVWVEQRHTAKRSGGSVGKEGEDC